jgi:cell division protein FtsB
MRLTIIVLAAVLVMLQLMLWVSDRGMRDVWRLEGDVERRTEENGELAARNAALEAEVLDLKDKNGFAAAEERARTELGMIVPGETIYTIVPARPPGGASR